jgi:hypothetical protein
MLTFLLGRRFSLAFSVADLSECVHFIFVGYMLQK